MDTLSTDYYLRGRASMVDSNVLEKDAQILDQLHIVEAKIVWIKAISIRLI
jgi:hypothetical protein